MSSLSIYSGNNLINSNNHNNNNKLSNNSIRKSKKKSSTAASTITPPRRGSSSNNNSIQMAKSQEVESLRNAKSSAQIPFSYSFNNSLGGSCSSGGTVFGGNANSNRHTHQLSISSNNEQINNGSGGGGGVSSIPMPMTTYENDDDDDDDESEKPTGCFNLRRMANTQNSSTSTSTSTSTIKPSNQIYPVGGHKKHSLDSKIPSLVQTQRECSSSIVVTTIDNVTYDRVFYKAMQKSLDEIFSTPCDIATISSANRHVWNHPEKASSKSSGDLTMYSFDSASQQGPPPNDTEIRSGSQFPRHCFFRQESNSLNGNGKVAMISKSSSSSSSRSSSRSEVDQFSESFNSSSYQPCIHATNCDYSSSADVSRKSSMVTFQCAKTTDELSSSSNQDQDCFYQESYNSFSFTTNYSDEVADENADDIVAQPSNTSDYILPNSVMASRKLKDIQPDAEVIKYNNSSHLHLSKQGKKKKTVISGGKLKNLISFFSFGTLKRNSKKKLVQTSGSSAYTLLKNNSELNGVESEENAIANSAPQIEENDVKIKNAMEGFKKEVVINNENIKVAKD